MSCLRCPDMARPVVLCTGCGSASGKTAHCAPALKRIGLFGHVTCNMEARLAKPTIRHAKLQDQQSSNAFCLRADRLARFTMSEQKARASSNVAATAASPE